MAILHFYQVQHPDFKLPPQSEVYLTLKQISTRPYLIPLDYDDTFPSWFLIAQLSHAPLRFEPGEVFGMKKTPPAELGHLKTCHPHRLPKPVPDTQALCTFDALRSQPAERFTQLTGMTPLTFSLYLALLPEPQPHQPGRPLRRSLEECLYLWALHTQGRYTDAQLAQCYQCSITQVYAPIQWVHQHLPSYYQNLKLS